MNDASPQSFFARLGGWLFPRRTWIPFPLIAALLLIPPQQVSTAWLWVGAALVLAGELLRLDAVRHIGVISRTRSDRLGPLVASGPFAWVRNPLYLGNITLWIGFSFLAQLPWLAPVLATLLLFEYHAIVRWEERLLRTRIGDSYAAYVERVPRWIPRPPREGRRAQEDSGLSAQEDSRLRPQGSGTGAVGASTFSWGDTLFSERGTLMAIALGCALLWIKSRA